MRVGVVGCGYWGAKHLRVLRCLPAVRDVVAVDPLPERRAQLARSAPGVTAFADLESALPHVDAVVIATPPTGHSALALQALIAGRHVLVEKPMTTSTASARRLIEEAAARELTLMVGHTFEYNAAVWKLRELIGSGELGEVYHVETARLNLGIYQADVNVVWDLAPHDISILNYLLQSVPRSVHTWAARCARFCQEDVGHLLLGYDDPAVRAQVHVSWLDPCKVRRVTVVGSRKMAVYDDLADQEWLRVYDKGPAVVPPADPSGCPTSYRDGGVCAPRFPMREPLHVQDEHFVECVLTGRRPRTDGESGLAVVRVLEAAAQSMQRGGEVSIADGDPRPDRLTARLAPRSLDLLRHGT
jgi:predicted dehydrogenase